MKKAHFVVHEHHASHLHFDFRLEIAGTLKSWAVPKGPSLNPAEKRLAIAVPDHPLDYRTFEGIIPAGHYGAGVVVIWDEGLFEPLEEPLAALRKGHFSFRLEGEKLRGEFALARMRGRDSDKDWLLMKKDDEFAEAGWTLQPVLTAEQSRKLAEQMNGRAN